MTGFIERLASTGLPLLALAVVATAITYVLARRYGGPGAARLAVARVLLVLTVGALLWWALLLSNPDASATRTANLVPFREIVRALTSPDAAYGAINFVGNIVVFAPIGALAVLSLRRRGWAAWRAATAFGTALSLTVEVVQYGIGRSADIDDILLNGAGTALGALCVLALRRRSGSTEAAECAPTA